MSPQVVYGPGRHEVPRTSAPGRSNAPQIPIGHVQLYCGDPAFNLVLPLGDSPVKISAGGGGWEIVGRPHQTGMTIWQGGEPYALTLPLMLDNFARRTSVERAMRAIERLSRGTDDSEPGVLQVGGIPLPVDDWIIETIEYGDPIRAVQGMAVIRQPLTLTLREYVPPDYVQLRRRSLLKPRRKTKIYTVKKNDTPAKIARRFKCKVKALKELNPKIIRTGRQKAQPKNKKGAKFKIGTKIRVPVKPARPNKPGGGGGGGNQGGNN